MLPCRLLPDDPPDFLSPILPILLILRPSHEGLKIEALAPILSILRILRPLRKGARLGPSFQSCRSCVSCAPSGRAQDGRRAWRCERSASLGPNPALRNALIAISIYISASYAYEVPPRSSSASEPRQSARTRARFPRVAVFGAARGPQSSPVGVRIRLACRVPIRPQADRPRRVHGHSGDKPLAGASSTASPRQSRPRESLRAGRTRRPPGLPRAQR